MSFLKQEQFAFPTVASLIDAARGMFKNPEDDIERLIAKPAPVAPPVVSDDQSRYARMLERELDRQILTEVERHDSDMLERVRAALYED